MIILSMRTDKPEAELGLFDDSVRLGYHVWPAHRQLAETLHIQIADLLERNEVKLKEIQGIIVFAGPGSFTGLRIGISVANALAYSLDVPVVASITEDWISLGYKLLQIAEPQPTTYVLPGYGSPVHITTQKK